ncbi:VC0807 family protein [Amycolatopsis sp. NPDC024027]|uniref:VC0807 family protein n=1 Tax=Amycolatopsis sp. NPDC024027 TaxID=3154327 RepID=UPI0033E1C38E
MSSVTQRQPRTKATSLLSSLLEIVLSIGGYYLLRAFGVGVFWALTAPAVAVAVVAVVVTVRRRRIDLIGLLVLCEIAATITLSLATQNPRIAALREAAYVLIPGVFCLVTLVRRAPLTHASTMSIATFGDPKREQAFEHAWRDVPEYRLWQRLLTASLGLIMIVTSATKAYILLSTPDDRIAHAVDVCNTITLVMIGTLVVTSAALIQRPKKIIERLLEQT